MALPPNKLLIGTGVLTLVQAATQAMFAAYAIAQYYCVIDFLKGFPLLVLIRILYFNNPDGCGTMINIGQVYEDMVDQAFVLVTREPFTTHRTFLINCISLGLSVVWILGSLLLIKGGTRRHHSYHTHWPWLAITLLITLLDFVALIAFANDSFHTKTLDEIMTYIGGTSSGVGNIGVNTRWVSWSMVILYSRFGIFLIVNVTLMVFGVVDCTRFRSSVTSSEVDRNRGGSPEVSEEGAQTAPTEEAPTHAIPRPGISRSFRAMKNFLFNGASERLASLNEGRNRNRGVNFSEEVEAPTFESMIGEQQKRLTAVEVDTSGRRSSAQGARLTRALSLVNLTEPTTGLMNLPGPNVVQILHIWTRRSGTGVLSRRGTAAELQGQMPWAYIPASSNRMRDQLPPDEDLPPVPLPDYTAFQSTRKASVHRAASSLSSMTQKKDYTPYQSPHQQPGQETATRLPEPEPVQVASVETPVSETSNEDSVYSLITIVRPEGWVSSPLPARPSRARATLLSMVARRLQPLVLLLPHDGCGQPTVRQVVRNGICAFFLVGIALYGLLTILLSTKKHWKNW